MLGKVGENKLDGLLPGRDSLFKEDLKLEWRLGQEFVFCWMSGVRGRGNVNTKTSQAIEAAAQGPMIYFWRLPHPAGCLRPGPQMSRLLSTSGACCIVQSCGIHRMDG